MLSRSPLCGGLPALGLRRASAACGPVVWARARAFLTGLPGACPSYAWLRWRGALACCPCACHRACTERCTSLLCASRLQPVCGASCPPTHVPRSRCQIGQHVVPGHRVLREVLRRRLRVPVKRTSAPTGSHLSPACALSAHALIDGGPTCASQARHSPKARREERAQATLVRERVARPWRAAEPRLGALRHPPVSPPQPA